MFSWYAFWVDDAQIIIIETSCKHFLKHFSDVSLSFYEYLIIDSTLITDKRWKENFFLNCHQFHRELIHLYSAVYFEVCKILKWNAWQQYTEFNNRDEYWEIDSY